MKLSNCVSAMALSTLACLSAPGFAQAIFPSKPIKLVVPQAPGGASDTIARLYSDFLSKSIGQPVIVENRPGANGILASTLVARQPADGYTLLLAGVSQLALNPITYKSLSYNPQKDFTGVALLVNTPFLLVAHPEAGIKTLDDVVRVAKAKPDSLNFASAGKGNVTHLVSELLFQRLNIQITHVPFNGSAPGLQSVLAGQTQLMSDVFATSAPQAKNGKVVPIAVIGEKRQPALPDVPTVAELGVKDFPAPGWYALVAPAGTPKPIVDRLNAETQKFLLNPEINAKLVSMSLEPLPSKPETVMQKASHESESFGPLIRKLGISND